VLPVDEKLGFNFQESGSCGIYAFLNSLLILGIPISVQEAHEVTRVTRIKALWEGTDPDNIIRGIKKYGCKAEPFSCKNEYKAKAKIDAYLEAGIPIIICVDDWEHYTLLAGLIDNRYYWIDSAGPNIMSKSSWPAIEEWMASSDEDEKYYGIAVIPPKRNNALKDIDKLFRLSRKDEGLFNNYGYMLRDLLDVIGDQKSIGRLFSVAEFLSIYQDKIVSSIEYLYYFTDKKYVTKKMKDYITIAELHNLSFAVADELDVIIRLTVIMTLNAAGIY
jgi:hypothetical protein